MLTPLGVLQANNWLKLNQKQSMLAIALPAAADDNWKSQPSNMSRPPHSSAPPIPSSASLSTPHHSASRDVHGSHQLASAPMASASSSTGTVIPSALPHSNGGSAASPSKPLTRSKSRGGSVGGFVHGIVNGVQASLRNVGHKSVQSVPANGYHSDHPPPSKPGQYKTKPSVSPTNSDSPEGPAVSDRSREQPSPVKPFNKALARSQSRGRAYESEGDNHTIGSIRHSRPSYPPISTSFATSSSDKVAKANGHTHIPLSPLSRENSTTQSITAISSALSRSSRSQSQSQSPPSPNLIPPTYTIRGPVSRSAARAILELDAIPPTELLKVLAALLEQIAAANDALRAERAARGEEPWDEQMAGINAKQEADLSLKPNLPLSPESPPATSPTSSRSRSQRRALSDSAPSPNTPIWNQLTNASRIALSSRTATLSFHARHIPQISLEAYLVRILKYCPTANATFVAVLVYFDRMCRMAANVEMERVNATETNGILTPLTRTESNGIDIEKSASGKGRPPFAIDSYNVHRLVIAGVTVASKFFSDVFYTNSRYAKVGGLPQAELNQLELQFLLLNDFSLVIPPEELARYAAQLIAYAQGRGTNLKPEGLGKGKLGREAKIVLGLEVEQEPEPDLPMETSPISAPAPYVNGYSHSGPSPRGYSHNMPRSAGSGPTSGIYRSAYQGTSYMHDNHSGMDITHDSETEVSTDEDSTIKARSGSESEASEWGVGSTEDEVDGGETETEGDDDDSDEDIGFYERRNSGDRSGGSESRVGRPRRESGGGGTPGGTKVMQRRQR